MRFLVLLTVFFGLAVPVKGYAASQQRFANLTCKGGECVWYRLAVKTDIRTTDTGRIVGATTEQCYTLHKEDYPASYQCQPFETTRQDSVAHCSTGAPSIAFKDVKGQWQRTQLSISEDGEFGFNRSRIDLYLRICHGYIRTAESLDMLAAKFGYRSRAKDIEGREQDTINSIGDVANEQEATLVDVDVSVRTPNGLTVKGRFRTIVDQLKSSSYDCATDAQRSSEIIVRCTSNANAKLGQNDRWQFNFNKISEKEIELTKAYYELTGKEVSGSNIEDFAEILFRPERGQFLSNTGRVSPAPQNGSAGTPKAASVTSKGFIFGSQDVHHATNPNQTVRLGEKITPQALKQRFTGYEVRYTKGEDCLTCAVISGADGQIEVSFAQNGRTIVDIKSYDDRSRDAQGNSVGSSLLKAIGSISAKCDAGMDTTCASPSLKGLWYIVADDSRCTITAQEKQLTDIPACALIAGFQILGN